AHADAVDARDRRLPDLEQRLVHPLERAEPLPVLLRVAEQVVGPGTEIGADAERATRTGHHEHADGVVPRDVLTRASKLAQHAEVEGVQDLGAVERDRRAWRRLLVDD